MLKWLRRAGTLVAVLLAQPLAYGDMAQGFELVKPATEKTISITIGTGQLIKVDEEFSSLFVANPDVADVEVKSPRLLYLTGIGVGDTTLFAVDGEDNVLMSARISVVHNAQALQKGFAQVAPGKRVKTTTINQSLVVTGSVDTPEQAADILNVAEQFVDESTQVVNRIQIAQPTQVNLQVRIAEVSRNIDRQLGIQWNEASIGGTGSRIGFISTGVAGANYASSFVSRGSGFNIDVVLQALSEEGMVSILAEPNLTARSGEAAEFLAGGEYPYAVVRDDEVYIDFKKYGIELEFAPTVLEKDHISLEVGTSVSELDFSNPTSATIPALKTRRARTTVDLASGQSFAIAGLMQNSSSQNESRMPGLGKIPILGALFKSAGFTRGQTELVIIVTPIIVKPTTDDRLRTPLDEYTPPNDVDRVLMGRFQGRSKGPNNGTVALKPGRLNGQAGFMFE